MAINHIDGFDSTYFSCISALSKICCVIEHLIALTMHLRHLACRAYANYIRYEAITCGVTNIAVIQGCNESLILETRVIHSLQLE